MVLTASQTATAERMGRRAGETFRKTGIPSRNPFTRTPELAQAWRAAYFTATG